MGGDGWMGMDGWVSMSIERQTQRTVGPCNNRFVRRDRAEGPWKVDRERRDLSSAARMFGRPLSPPLLLGLARLVGGDQASGRREACVVVGSLILGVSRVGIKTFFQVPIRLCMVRFRGMPNCDSFVSKTSGGNDHFAQR